MMPSAGPTTTVTEEASDVLVFPVSFAQQRLWFLEQLHPGGSAYNVPFSLHVSGPLDPAILAASLGALVARHESLRTTFATVGGEPVQVVSAPAPLPLPQIDLGALPPAARQDEARRLARGEARRPFDLRCGPLLRTLLVGLGGGEHRLFLTLHHIICDGWSMGIVVREVAALYRALAAGEPSPLPALPIQYADFAVWQRERLDPKALSEQLAYWRRQLAGAPAFLELPTDRPRPAEPGYAGDTCAFALPPELSQRLAAAAREAEVSLFMFLLAAFKALLARFAGRRDLLVGSPIANRHRRDVEPLVGFFVNTIVVRSRWAGEITFGQLLAQVRKAVLEANANQDLPFEKLLEELQPERNLHATPLFQVFFVFQDAPSSSLKIPGLEIRTAPLDNGASKFDLTLRMAAAAGGRIEGSFSYRTELFDRSTIRRLARRFELLVAQIAGDGDRPLSALALLTPGERQQLLREWNDTQTPAAAARSVTELFERAAGRHPGSPAVICGQRCLSYGELNARSNQLARYLRRLGVRPEARVGICLERSPEMMVALVGILKAGGAYVPLDPILPAGRLQGMLEDSAAEVLITRRQLLLRIGLRSPRTLCLDRDGEAIAAEDGGNFAGGVRPGHLVYLLFTSGSTGRPKGVAVEHRQLLNYLFAVRERFALAAGSSYVTVSTLAADLGNTAIFPALCFGGCLHVTTDEQLADPAALAEHFGRHRIDCLKVVPSHLAALRAAGAVERVLPRRLLVVGGEASRWEEVEELSRLVPGMAILNHYGPTESTIGVVTFRVPAAPGRCGPLPLGRPLPNTRIYLLDRRGEPVPMGSPGEVYAAGRNVTRGYHGRRATTAERFVPDPFAEEPGARLYRTGDLARYRADGLLEFLGRIDDQVQIRGFRVELGEVKAAVDGHPQVASAVVGMDHDGGSPRLVAWVVPQPGSGLSSGDLRLYLHAELPAYMVPAAFVLLDALPLTPQGKLDRSRLPAPDRQLARLGHEYVAPRTPVEEKLAAVWSEVLKIDQVGIHDDFFELGGHSLVATQLASRVRKALDVDLPLRSVFESTTIEALARAVEALARRRAPTRKPALGPSARRSAIG